MNEAEEYKNRKMQSIPKPHNTSLDEPKPYDMILHGIGHIAIFILPIIVMLGIIVWIAHKLNERKDTE